MTSVKSTETQDESMLAGISVDGGEGTALHTVIVILTTVNVPLTLLTLTLTTTPNLKTARTKSRRSLRLSTEEGGFFCHP